MQRLFVTLCSDVYVKGMSVPIKITMRYNHNGTDNARKQKLWIVIDVDLLVDVNVPSKIQENDNIYGELM